MGNVKSLLKLIPQIELIVFEDEADYINGSKTPCKIEMLEKAYISWIKEVNSFISCLSLSMKIIK